MTNNQNQPKQYDAVLGGNSPPPIHGAVLGGIEGVKKRLASSDVDVQISALNDALNYGDVGLDLVIPELESESINRRELAYRLLRYRKESQVKLALENYKFWDGFEKLYELPYGHSNKFANRKVIEFDIKTGITETVDTAYAFRVSHNWYSDIDISIETKFKKLRQKQQKLLAIKVEALVFGYSDYIENVLSKALDKFPNLKAIFIGDIEDGECMISDIRFPRVRFILNNLPKLEVLKIRGGCRISHVFSLNEPDIFNPFIKHDNLKALIIESGGLRKEIIHQICQLELPALKYL